MRAESSLTEKTKSVLEKSGWVWYRTPAIAAGTGRCLGGRGGSTPKQKRSEARQNMVRLERLSTFIFAENNDAVATAWG